MSDPAITPNGGEAVIAPANAGWLDAPSDEVLDRMAWEIASYWRKNSTYQSPYPLETDEDDYGLAIVVLDVLAGASSEASR